METARKECDMLIAVMSGDFCQRGIPGVYSKEERTRDVLSCADAVIELPVIAATASSDRFARGAVCLVDALGCVTDLYFGSESGDLATLQKEADVSRSEDPRMQQILRQKVAGGLSYPAAQAAAREEVFGISSDRNAPNDLLAVSYLRALSDIHSRITPHAIPRISTDSASSLREKLQQDPAADPHHSQCAPVFLDDFSSVLLGSLLAIKDYTAFSDVTPDLSDRFRNNLGYYRSITGFLARCKTKDVTWTRLSRCLLHILLGIRKDAVESYFTTGPQYARVLGYRRASAHLISLLADSAKVLVILRVADGERTLPREALLSYHLDLSASLLYDHIEAVKRGDTETEINAYKKKVLVLP
ncbi:MAG: nucleotidyltransferase family protein, partial [Lachnospiraceae bacterium]